MCFLMLLTFMISNVLSSMPPTLPHGQPAWHHEPLHINSVKEVIETFDKMWNNYTELHLRNVEAERHLAVSEERVNSSIAVCEAEKRGIQQICELRISTLQKEEYFKELHAKMNDHKGEIKANTTAVCECKLAGCDHSSVAEFTRQFLKRLDDIWHSKSMFHVSSDAKAELTLTAIQWAKDELTLKEKIDVENRFKCFTPISNTETIGEMNDATVTHEPYATNADEDEIMMMVE